MLKAHTRPCPWALSPRLRPRCKQLSSELGWQKRGEVMKAHARPCPWVLSLRLRLRCVQLGSELVWKQRGAAANSRAPHL